MRPFPLIRRRAIGTAHAIGTPTKLNLFLEVVGRRPDGFHELESLFLALDAGDTMLVRCAPEGRDSLRVSGVPAPEDGTNLVLRAIDRARASRPIPPLSVHLRKRTPMGAGLGGGSANAAGVLAHLHDLHPDPRGVEGVREDAASLGSDIPFFLFDHASAIGTGRGETLSPLRGPLFGGAPVAFVLVLPALHSSTAAAFARLAFPLTDPEGPISVPAKTFEDSGEWQRGVFNRLEGSVIDAARPLARLVEHLENDLVESRDQGKRARSGDGPGAPVPSPIADRPPDFARDFVPADRMSSSASTTRRSIMTGSGSAFFLPARDLTDARRLEDRLRRPGGALERFTAETGVAVETRCARPHLLLTHTPPTP